MKNEFFSQVDIEFLVHELKDPVSVIETSVQLLLDRRDTYGILSVRQEKTLKRALRNAKKARSMIHGLLEIGRSQAGCFNRNSFHLVSTIYDVLMEALETVCPSIYEHIHSADSRDEALVFLSGYNIDISVDPGISQAELNLDEVKFRQIAGNLIKNGLHHRKERIDVSVRCQNNMLCLEVTDDGTGISAEHHEMVFQRYTQLKANDSSCRTGHGLGLAGALILAKSMGGTIGIISQKGKGAAFRLMLPLG